MLASIALLIVTALLLNYLFEKIKLPGILGMMLAGVILSSSGLISPKFFDLAPELRFVALFVILIRAGFGIRSKELKKVGYPALKMSFLPFIIEAVFICFSARYFLGFTYIEASMLGVIISAVSPAVIVPSMIDLKEKGWGKDKEIPTLILASASLDNILAITIFASLARSYTKISNSISFVDMLSIPLSIILGALLGLILAYILIRFFKKIKMRDTKMALFIFASGVFAYELEKYIMISGFIAIMTLAYFILEKDNHLAEKLSSKFSKAWVIAEVFLFALIGAQIGLDSIGKTSLIGLGIVVIGLIGRSFGVIVSLIGSGLKKREKLFCIISFIPKATVQAALGAVPLAMGIDGGGVILSIAVLSIILTSPIGLVLINKFHSKLLKHG
jgi:NhaP-type Na+/H+ or K+/H+ antiporter